METIIQRSGDSLETMLDKILELSKGATEENKIDLEVIFGEGEYFLSEPLKLSAEEHPELVNMNITFRGEGGNPPVFHSKKKIDPKGFTKVSDGIYKMCFERDADGKYPVFRELYKEGRQLPIAKSEGYVHPFGMPDRNDPSNPENERCLFIPESEAKILFDHGSVAPAELTMFLEWEWCNAPIGSIDKNDTRDHDGVTYLRLTLADDEHVSFVKNRHPIIDVCNRRFHLTNHPALLTPGTYCYSSKTGELYYCKEDGESIDDTYFSYPTLEQLFVFEGLTNVTLQGLTFTGAGSRLIAEKMYFACQSNAEKRYGLLHHAAVLTKNMRNFTVDSCSFLDLGGNGILMTDNSIRVRIQNSRFYRNEMSAIVIGNRTTAWENPKNRNFDIAIVNNRLHTIGHGYPAAGGIYISMIDGLRILHNTIENTAYSGMTIGWGWSKVDYSLGEKVNIRDAEIAYNKIVDFMQLMRDGAAIYVLGANCTRERSGQFNFMHDNYAEREMYVDHSKRGYYMDGSSSNWEVYDNVIFGVRLPIFSQFHVPSQYTYHNYIHDIYTDFPIDSGNIAPERDTRVENCTYVPEGKDTLFTLHPKARAILDAAGSNLEF